MRPTKLSSKLFSELPPVLAHYVEAERNLWIDGNPRRGRLSLLNRSGNFIDLEALAVERRHLIQVLGMQRARALRYRTGFEQGRRDGRRHFTAYGESARLALQAGLVFGQLQGRFIAESVSFELDLESRTLHRELLLKSCVESVVHRMTLVDTEEPVCWATAGYLSGHLSEIIGRRVVTLESECACQGAEACRFVSRLDPECGAEADWVRKAMTPSSVIEEIEKRDRLIADAQKAARSAQSALSDIKRRMSSDMLLDTLVAESDAMKAVVARVRQFATSAAPVIVQGEPGSGRCTVAKSIHFASERQKKPFVEVDCSALPDGLLMQELFGYVKGALPGVGHAHKGAFLRAHGGTLYLDDITGLSMDMQAQVLRVAEEGKVLPLGAEKSSKCDVRIMAGANKDLRKEVTQGNLRQDLYYALSVGQIQLPPLRDRGIDILRLAQLFLREFEQRHGRRDITMSQEFKRVLMDCAWPGNLRQLRNVLEHAVIMTQGKQLSPVDLPDEILATRWSRKPEALTEEVIRAALSRTHNNRSQAADLLGVGRTTLWRAMKRMSIE